MSIEIGKKVLTVDDIVCELSIPLPLKYWKMIKASLEKDNLNILSDAITRLTARAEDIHKKNVDSEGEIVMDMYNDAFYDKIVGKYSEFAAVLCAVVIKHLRPKSVVDVGCGMGLYLAEFKALGLDVTGIEGSQSAIDRSEVKTDIINLDLSSPMLYKHETFGLCMSFEVAEHIEEEKSDTFLKNIISLSDTVLFSAAIKGQLGDGHVNEQPPAYWISRFEKLGYIHMDAMVISIKKEIKERMGSEKLKTLYPYLNMMIFIKERLG